jgi:hypothetical protein
MFATLTRLLTLACLMLVPQTTTAAELAIPERLPKFADFPAKIYRGKVKKPILENEWMRDRPELFSSYSSKEAMVAGHYALFIATCGSSCQDPVLIDVRTGKALPTGSISGWREFPDDFNPVLTRPNSRLIVLQGALMEEKPNGVHYFVVENGKLKHLRTIETDGDFSKKPRL